MTSRGQWRVKATKFSITFISFPCLFPIPIIYLYLIILSLFPCHYFFLPLVYLFYTSSSNFILISFTILFLHISNFSFHLSILLCLFIFFLLIVFFLSLPSTFSCSCFCSYFSISSYFTTLFLLSGYLSYPVSHYLPLCFIVLLSFLYILSLSLFCVQLFNSFSRYSCSFSAINYFVSLHTLLCVLLLPLFPYVNLFILPRLFFFSLLHRTHFHFCISSHISLSLSILLFTLYLSLLYYGQFFSEYLFGSHPLFFILLLFTPFFHALTVLPIFPRSIYSLYPYLIYVAILRPTIYLFILLFLFILVYLFFCYPKQPIFYLYVFQLYSFFLVLIYLPSLICFILFCIESISLLYFVPFISLSLPFSFYSLLYSLLYIYFFYFTASLFLNFFNGSHIFSFLFLESVIVIPVLLCFPLLLLLSLIYFCSLFYFSLLNLQIPFPFSLFFYSFTYRLLLSFNIMFLLKVFLLLVHLFFSFIYLPFLLFFISYLSLSSTISYCLFLYFPPTLFLLPFP